MHDMHPLPPACGEVGSKILEKSLRGRGGGSEIFILVVVVVVEGGLYCWGRGGNFVGGSHNFEVKINAWKCLKTLLFFQQNFLEATCISCFHQYHSAEILGYEIFSHPSWELKHFFGRF